MNDSLFFETYKPDVLLCLANLSSDEVFTTPEIANQMIDLLPQELFKDPNITFLDPGCKTGIFLREIAKRLIVGLEETIPNLNDRINHIMKKQLYGISITELTSLLSRRSVYCSKYPNSIYSISKFDNSEGNIRFKRIEHSWVGDKCSFCGASKKEYDRNSELETHAYEWIHCLNPEEIFNMKFDVIIGNPPYQLSDGGGSGTSAKPIYQLFVKQAIKLNPRYLTMIIPSRWFSGGKGLDEFRKEMLGDRRIRTLVDYDNYKDVFPTLGGLAGGVCYFLWDRDNPGLCDVANYDNGEMNHMTRAINEYDFFIRSNKSLSILKKITEISNCKYLSDRISSRLPFGITTTYTPLNSGVPCYFTQKLGIKYVSKKDIIDNNNYLNKWKLLIPKAPIAGQTDFSKPVGFYYDGNIRIAKPGECCSESWLVACAFETESETINFKSFLLTKIVRFLLLQTVVSQNITKKNFCFVPDVMDYSHSFSDDLLRELWDISDEEWEFINSKIRNIEDGD
ncbi:MAG: Eco57I restriction-modification methylase domain-containing protein [Bacilli bacterium]